MSRKLSNQRDDDVHYSVTQINQMAAKLLESKFAEVDVEGEISELIRHRSGHWYFTLKDDNALLKAALFRYQNQQLAFSPKDGDKVKATGKLTVYPQRGSYQLVVQSMRPAGEGDLLKRFLKLKQELEALGWFSPDSKKALPKSIQTLVIITSAQGAAFQDIQATFARRDPGISLIIVPVRVQGDGASTEIANALSRVNQLQLDPNSELRCDAIVLARGGGSLEDLWAFNEKNLAKAIVASQLPVVSAVGHETDFTIADWVADLRAATPTAAAELLSSDRRDAMTKTTSLQQRIHRGIFAQLGARQQQLEQLTRRLRSPISKLQQQAQSLDFLENRLSKAIARRAEISRQHHSQLQIRLQTNNPQSTFQERFKNLLWLHTRLKKNIQLLIDNRQQQFETLGGALHLVSPLATLERGYTITRAANNRIIKSSRVLKPKQKMITRFADGEIISIVEQQTNT